MACSGVVCFDAGVWFLRLPRCGMVFRGGMVFVRERAAPRKMTRETTPGGYNAFLMITSSISHQMQGSSHWIDPDNNIKILW